MIRRRASRKESILLGIVVGAGTPTAACGAPAATPTTAPQPAKPAAAPTTAAAAPTSAPAAPTFESGGKQGEEQPDWFKPGFDAFTKDKDTLATEEANKHLSLQATNVWSIGTVGEAPLPVTVRVDLRNYPSFGVNVWAGNASWPVFTEPDFIKK